MASTNLATSDFFEAAEDYLLGFGEKGQAVFTAAKEFADEDESVEFLREAIDTINSRKVSSLATKGQRKFKPVGMREFLLSEYYLDLAGQIYPVILDELCELNSGKYVEAVLTGGIGVAKTTMALWTTAYQLYLLSSLRDPQGTFGLDRASEIMFIFQSINKELAKNLNFARFKALLEHSPYFKKHFPFDKDILSELRFPHRIVVKPVSGMDTAAIGQNVIGGLIDELNYMAVVENSKSSVDGGTYDQAVSVYNSLARRRKSRFLQQGVMPGILCLVSSKRYPGQFTDKKQEEAMTDPTIYVYDKRIWDIKPDSFMGNWFRVFIGDEFRKPRLMPEGDEVSEEDKHLVMPVPDEYKHDFETDIINALREIGGISTLAKLPFMVDTDKVASCFGKAPGILTRIESDLQDRKVEVILDNISDSTLPRFVHEDLSISRDSTGVTCGHVTGFREVKRGKEVEILPEIEIDFTLEVSPPVNGEIQFWKIREMLYKLRELGLNLKWITFDSFQSTDSQQILSQKGFITGKQSMDTDTAAYEVLKSALYDGRVSIPEHPLLLRELLSLEWEPKKGQIDHPAVGSKDVADSLAGVVYGLTMRRENWLNFGVNPSRIPASLTSKKETMH